MTYIEQAIEIVGGPTALAEKVGVTKQAVNRWTHQGYTPPAQVRAVWLACKRKVSIHALLVEAEEGLGK